MASSLETFLSRIATGREESKKRLVVPHEHLRLQSLHRLQGNAHDDDDGGAANGQVADTVEALPRGFDTPCAPELFSQGQWQLLSIARAAVTNPQILLLDEITANLDAETERMVLQALKNVSENRTVISISHRTEAKEGRIVPIGKP